MSEHINETIPTTGIWNNAVKWLRAFDEALDHDPVEVLHNRIEILESRLQKIDEEYGRHSADHNN